MRRGGVGFVESRVHLGLAAGVLALLALLGASEAGQVARDPDDEVLIGTVDLPPPMQALPNGGNIRPVQETAAVKALPVSTTESNERYTSALQALESGNFALAQELFEKVIAEDPQGPRAASARQHLGQLYTAAPDGGAALGPAAPAQPAAAASTPVAPGPDNLAIGNSNLEGDDDGPNPLNSASVAGQGPWPADDMQRFVIEAGDRVFFGPGSADLGARARSVLLAQSKWLKKRPEWNITIEGHADDPPMNERELEDLSEARAEAVRQRLVTEGVAVTRIAIVPWGRHAPISDCADPSCQVQNRRAVSVLQPRRGPGPRELSEKSGRSNASAGVPWAASRSEPSAR